jgi:hypothetical protein
MPYDDKTIEDPERDRWKDKKVDGRDAVGMVAEKRAPALRWWPRVAAHIPSDCRLSDLEAELEQFTMNVWGCAYRKLSSVLVSAGTMPYPEPLRGATRRCDFIIILSGATVAWPLVNGRTALRTYPTLEVGHE